MATGRRHTHHQTLPWWNEPGQTADLITQLLRSNHPEDANEIIQSGSGYLAVFAVHLMLDMISETVERVGPSGFDSTALYDTATSFTATVDGFKHSFTESKRTSGDTLGIYELRADLKDLLRVDHGPVPTVHEP